MTAPAHAAESRCDECGYRLRGLTVTRCPECGTEFNPHAAPQADVPWLRRTELGVTSAYVQTVDIPTFIWRGLTRRASQLSPLHQYISV